MLTPPESDQARGLLLLFVLGVVAGLSWASALGFIRP